MKQLLLIGIRLYRRLLPTHRAGQCLFSESCSQHVTRITHEQGFVAGIRAFVRRTRQCRRGFRVVSSPDGGRLELILSDGAILRGDEISSKVFSPLLEQVAHFEAALNQQPISGEMFAQTR